MSFLVPLYLAGLAAASLPFVLHLVRKTPRNRQEFSSLMFLAPTPPRVTRRSRLEQFLLLALRITALVLLAIAFARPFLREAAALSLDSLPGRRVAILLDTSASMRRADLWPKALQAVEKELDDLGQHEDVALYVFDDRLRSIVDFQPEHGGDIIGKPQIVRQQLKALQPGWAGTDLGAALTAVASDLEASTDVRGSMLEPQIVVVSDFQKGSRLEALQSYEWPAAIPAVLRPLTVGKSTNAYVRILSRDDEDENEATTVRVRVASAADSVADQFQIAWSGDGAGASPASETSVYVPPGQSRVVRMTRPVESAHSSRIRLRGDDHDFDNAFFVVPLRKQNATIVYVGADHEGSPQGLLHFFRLAVSNDPFRAVDVQAVSPEKLLLPREGAPQMVVVSTALPVDVRESLEQYAERGGSVLLVPVDEVASQSIPAFFEDAVVAGTSLPAGRDYLLLGEIDFNDPLFVPFQDARYNDFTRIHFWKRRQIELKQPSATRVLARFDDGSPALMERKMGPGRVWALASGWHPDDSQLALSSKFVPLMGQMIDLACGTAKPPAGLTIDEPISLAPVSEGSAIVIRTPDGEVHRLEPGADRFTATTMPGIYTVSRDGNESQIAVNLPAEESETTPLDLEQLEQRGVHVKNQLSRAQRIEQVRQQRDTELESRQRIWRWLIAAAIVILVLETWRAGWVERRQNRATEVVA